MKLHLFFLPFLFSLSAALAAEPLDELYEKLQQDFESKPYFFNSGLNEQRDKVMSPFIPGIFKYNFNNAQPLSAHQLKNLPDAVFLHKEPFVLAMKGRERLLAAGKIKNHPIMAIIDFSLHSRIRRLYILDLEKGEVLINNWVSHGAASDSNKDGLADNFSNQPGSKKSSVGFMVTDKTYYGSFGYSLRMRGLDPKLNSNVYSRAVVIHGFGGMGAHQASWGNSSTSEGCPMISLNESGRFWGMEDESLRDIVINTLKGGALVFTYTDELDQDGQEYIFKSSWIKKSDLP